MRNFLIIGAGFSGTVVAEQLSRALKCRILVLESRGHIGGNCYTEIDPATGILIHRYGPHIFHTHDLQVWNYIRKFADFHPYINRVKAVCGEEIYSLPVNLHTINQFFRRSLDPRQAREFIRSRCEPRGQESQNFEELALSTLGRELYEAFFYGYTKKQWGCEPRELPGSILSRIPIRFDYNDNYYNSPFQGIPRQGYTPIFEKMLDHSSIEVNLNARFEPGSDLGAFERVIYTGPIDAFFDYRFGPLGYRSVYFERGECPGDFQGNAVINYCDLGVPFTRIHEPRHFTPWMESGQTVYFREYSRETAPGESPFYPKRLNTDLEKLKAYQEAAGKLPKFIFLGRLASYRYLNMDQAIRDALDCSGRLIRSL